MENYREKLKGKLGGKESDCLKKVKKEIDKDTKLKKFEDL